MMYLKWEYLLNEGEKHFLHSKIKIEYYVIKPPDFREAEFSLSDSVPLWFLARVYSCLKCP